MVILLDNVAITLIFYRLANDDPANAYTRSDEFTILIQLYSYLE